MEGLIKTFCATLLSAPFPWLLPPQQGAGPGEAAAESGKANQIPFFYFTFFPGFIQCYRYGRRCGITVFLNIIVYLVITQMHLLLHKLGNTQISLVGY